MRAQMRVDAHRAPCRRGQSLARSTCATWPSACTPASVRPAPCDRRRARRQNAAIAVGQHALHRQAVVLDLPADERRAVIFDGELVARHGGFSAGRVPRATGVPRKNSSAVIGCRAGALQFDDAHRARRRRRRSVCRPARVPGRRRRRLGRAQHLRRAPAPGNLEPGAGKRRQPAEMVVRPPSTACVQSMRVSALSILAA